MGGQTRAPSYAVDPRQPTLRRGHVQRNGKHRDPTLLRARDRSASNYIFMGDLDRSIVLSSCSYTRQRFSRRSPFSLASVYGDL